APETTVEKVLAGIYAHVLGLQRVGIDDSFFELGGDSILSMQLVARARTAGVLCRPRDIFTEQTVAKVARIARVVDDEANSEDDGAGHLVATPSMCWLAGVAGPVEQFNLSMLIQAPAGASEGDAAIMLQALIDRHPMLRLQVDDDDDQTGGWALTVLKAGSVDAGACLQAVDTMSDEVLVQARSRLDPAAGAMLRALWVVDTRELILLIHHLAFDAQSRRIVLDDLNTAWGQHLAGQKDALPAAGTSFARWASLLAEQARRPEIVAHADIWRRVAATPAALPHVQPSLDTFATAGDLSVMLDVETTRMLLDEVPAAFHATVQDILLIAFALAWTEFLGYPSTVDAPIGIGVEDHGRHQELAPDVDLSHTVGWFTTTYPVSLTVGGVDWAQVVAGESRLGEVLKDAKDQLRALPNPLSYGMLRYLNTEVELAGPDPTIGFNYVGPLGVSATHANHWQLRQEKLSDIAAARAIPMPLMYTAALSAAIVDSGIGPRLRADWSWAPSALDRAAVGQLNRLWFEALVGVCALVRRGGGGLTPSDILPARLSQQQLDDLDQLYDIADILPLTPLQQGLLFHADTAHGGDGDLYAMQLDFTVSGALDSDRLREALHTVVARHPNLAARFLDDFDEPVQIIPANPVPGWRYLDLGGCLNVDEQVSQVCAAERAAVCDLGGQSAFRLALIRVAPDRHRLLLTHHHIVLDGWSWPILLGEIFASYHGQRLAPAGRYRKFLTFLAGRDLDADRSAWRKALAGFDTPTLVDVSDRLGLGARGVQSFRVHAETTRAISALARSCHTTVNTVLKGAWAQLLIWLTGHHDVTFGTTVSGRPAEVAGSESMVGLLVTTVPVRATVTSTTTTADLLNQLQRAHNQTLEHQHLALSEIHRVAGHDRLFDTLFVYENYPIDIATLFGGHELTVTEFVSHDSTHYPLTLAAVPGPEIELRLKFRTDLFDPHTIEALIDRFQQILLAMTNQPAQRLSSRDLLTERERARLDTWGNRAVLNRPGTTAASIPAMFAAQVARTPDRVAVSCGARSMTYRDLDEAANELAHVLAAHGVGPRACAALLFSRSVEAIVAIVAVLKTGAAYLPIDPMLGSARIKFMIADATPIAAITTTDLAHRLDGCDVVVIDVDAPGDPAGKTQPGVALPVPAPDDIAYLIYTSGTTGVPKGVAITHRNVTQLIDTLHEHTHLRKAPGVWTQGHSYGFDVSVKEIWGALLSGGRLVLVPEPVAGSPDDFHALLIAENVSVLTSTPRALAMLSPQGLESLAVLAVGGEPCPPDLVDRWAPGRVMINAYGPTETTIRASGSSPLVAGSGAVPIGSPVSGAALFVLDGWLHPVPPGVAGELYVAGAGV
ncbi:MAG: condensation domain-containing protein, partial [Actinomycetota bacterium]|nr:condensation domain-containing protein [Actinomycetota bacterium]